MEAITCLCENGMVPQLYELIRIKISEIIPLSAKFFKKW